MRRNLYERKSVRGHTVALTPCTQDQLDTVSLPHARTLHTLTYYTTQGRNREREGEDWPWKCSSFHPLFSFPFELIGASKGVCGPQLTRRKGVNGLRSTPFRNGIRPSRFRGENGVDCPWNLKCCTAICHVKVVAECTQQHQLFSSKTMHIMFIWILTLAYVTVHDNFTSCIEPTKAADHKSPREEKKSLETISTIGRNLKL